MDYNPNSNRFLTKDKPTEEENLGKKKVDKVVSGSVKTKKKSSLSKFADTFIEEDKDTVVGYLLSEVLIPSFKKMVSDTIKTGIDKMLYGDAEVSRSNSPASKISYSKYYNDKSSYSRSSSTAPVANRRDTYEYNNIVLETRGDAEAVLMGMDDIIAKYEIVSVADLYDLVGIAGSYTDYKYGWTDIRSARIERVRDGYVIRMPKALPLD
jgi:hypothetical protein|nr:MAG TPA: hypothetical protein [Bacteriophage sp.]